jgi:hypothetical protein
MRPTTSTTIRRAQWCRCAARAVFFATALLWGTGVDGPSHATEEDVVGHAEQALKRAAIDSPHWHARRDAIERDIHDITLFLDHSMEAAEKSDHAARKDFAQQALTLLERSANLGHIDLAKAEPVLMLIRRLLSDRAG